MADKQLNKGKLFSYITAGDKDPDFFRNRNQANYLLQGSKSVQSDGVSSTVSHAISSYNPAQLTNSKHYLDQFVKNFTHWIGLSDLFEYQGDFSNGTTQAFDSFYLRHCKKRFRCYPGEYFYHLKTWESNNVRWSFITDNDPLVPGDAVVLSVPFCDTGNVQHIDIISHCESLEIPILLDMCYYPLTELFKIDLTSAAIDTISFSLSKIFPVAHHRIGVRYTKKNVFDGQKLHHTIGYANVMSAYIGQSLLDKYSADYIHTKYRQKQQIVCEFLSIDPSQSTIFALGNSDWNMYNRSNLIKEYKLDFDPLLFCNRICLVPFFENWDLFERFKNAY